MTLRQLACFRESAPATGAPEMGPSPRTERTVELARAAP